MTAQFRALHVIDVALTSSLQSGPGAEPDPGKGGGPGRRRAWLAAAAEPRNRRTGPESLLGEGWTPEVQGLHLSHRSRDHGLGGRAPQPYLCPDAHQDPQNVVLFEEMRSGVAVPLLVGAGERTEPTNSWACCCWRAPVRAAFDQHDVELLEALAQEAVIAIQNATQQPEAPVDAPDAAGRTGTPGGCRKMDRHGPGSHGPGPPHQQPDRHRARQRR